MQMAALHAQSKAEVDRGTEELNAARREHDERMNAMRAQLEQQEVDNAALLDVVQVSYNHAALHGMLCVVPAALTWRIMYGCFFRQKPSQCTSKSQPQ